MLLCIIDIICIVRVLKEEIKAFATKIYKIYSRAVVTNIIHK
jgi:hypothetical protein